MASQTSMLTCSGKKHSTFQRPPIRPRWSRCCFARSSYVTSDLPRSNSSLCLSLLFLVNCFVSGDSASSQLRRLDPGTRLSGCPGTQSNLCFLTRGWLIIGRPENDRERQNNDWADEGATNFALILLNQHVSTYDTATPITRARQSETQGNLSFQFS